jgi:hypothetical protein
MTTQCPIQHTSDENTEESRLSCDEYMVSLDFLVYLAPASELVYNNKITGALYNSESLLHYIHYREVGIPWSI